MQRKLLLPLVFIMVLAYGGLALTLIVGNKPELGLDLQGGVSVVLAPTKKASGDQLDQSLNIIRSRVDALGVAEPDITRQGQDIVVQLPGVKNHDRALALVGQTAELRFRPVLQDLTGLKGVPSEPTATTTVPSTTTTAPKSTSTSEGALGLVPGESAAAAQPAPTTTAATSPTTTAPKSPATTAPPAQQTVPITSSADDKPESQVILPGPKGKGLYQLGPALATGRIVKTAQAELNPQGQWQVALKMHGGANGIDKFNQIAAQCYAQAPNPQVCPSGRLAIVLDSIVQSAPSITNQSYQADQISISGSFSQSEAKNLALVLRYGSLPVELQRQSLQTVSASLGSDSLRAGIIAGFVGLTLVALYMLAYYRALGIVVVVGLSVWGSLLYTIVSFLGTTQGLALTLAGVTGIIVSIGVTVDSYVVFFERLKDEVKSGRTVRSSAERAFKRAFRTIVAADTSAFIGAAVLWWLTVGSVRGFAFFLGLSTILDVTVAWFFTRPAFTLLARSPVFTDMPVLGVARGLATTVETPTSAERPPVTAGVGR
jgi:preprotein translocase subunit SecD